ncbi:GNAT family N-acetyltransferase [Psychromicrobium lacuslunae]|uniref:GNAT family N-acetyltransferase n=1 Tax=Psychromicrobium lacuslunae TaxID=1618207 RepID=UPI000AE8E1BB|nr:GNAT family N-acetyltransferase [Psychromicrobium lacuslunae]
MSSVKLRFGGDADVESCLMLWRSAVLLRDGAEADQLGLEAQLLRSREQFERVDRILLLATDDRGLAGFVLGFPDPGQGGSHLVLIATDPRSQGQGVAGSLLAEFAKLRQSRGDHWLDLRVLVNNFAAQRLYERLGWLAVGEPEPHEVTGKLFQWYKLALS